MASGVPVSDTIAQHFSVPSPGAVNDKVRSFFDQWYGGNGSPEGVVTAGIGKVYLQYDAADAAHAIWVKNTGTGNTGWVQSQSGTSDAVSSTDVTTIVVITQAAYDALSPPDPETLYLIPEA